MGIVVFRVIHQTKGIKWDLLRWIVFYHSVFLLFLFLSQQLCPLPAFMLLCRPIRRRDGESGSGLTDCNETTWFPVPLSDICSDKEAFQGSGVDPVSTSAGRRSSACTPSSSGRPPPSAVTASSSPGPPSGPAGGPGWSSVCRTPAGSERRRPTCCSERRNQRGEREHTAFYY